MKLNSFGCSFIFGSDLKDDVRDEKYLTPSQLSWPALMAQEYKCDYTCYARPGSGNLRILESVLTHAAAGEKDLCVIGWTWIDRFDYTDPVDKWNTILPVDDSALAKTYYKELHSQYRDKLSTLIYIKTAIDTLNHHRIPFVMTFMDDLIFETKWHTTPAVTNAQDFIRPYMTTFEGKNFLDWSRKNNYEISTTLHPLEKAHAKAAELMLKEIRNSL